MNSPKTLNMLSVAFCQGRQQDTWPAINEIRNQVDQKRTEDAKLWNTYFKNFYFQSH